MPWEGNTSGFGASRVQGGERSCTEAAGIAEPSPGQLRPGGAGLCSSGEEEQRTLSCQRSRCRQGSGFGSGGSGFGEPHGEGRLAQGCGAGCEGGRGQALCPQLWGRAVTRDAGRRGLEGDSGEGLSGPCTVPAHPPLSGWSISRDRDPPPRPAWGSSFRGTHSGMSRPSCPRDTALPSRRPAREEHPVTSPGICWTPWAPGTAAVSPRAAWLLCRGHSSSQAGQSQHKIRAELTAEPSLGLCVLRAGRAGCDPWDEVGLSLGGGSFHGALAGAAAGVWRQIWALLLGTRGTRNPKRQ